MAESTLSPKFEEIKSHVAHHQYGGDLDISATGTFSLLATSEQEVVKSIVRSGLRQFYNPPPIRKRAAHKWTFLEKTDNLVLKDEITAGTITYTHTGGAQERLLEFTTPHGFADTPAADDFLIELEGVSYPIGTRETANNLTIVIDDNPGANLAAGTSYRLHQDDYDLPDDFGTLLGPITFVEKERAWYQVAIVGEGRIREYRQRDSVAGSSSKPTVAAITNRTNVQTSGFLKKIMFWPAITSAFVMKIKYRVRPLDDLADADYPYGVSDHAETILYSCLAESERRLDEAVGVNYQRFIESLASSIDLDNRSGRAHSLGYNSDWSDASPYGGGEHIFGSRVKHKNYLGNFTD
jgi:hypothetical protein